MSRIQKMRQRFKEQNDGNFDKNRGYEFWKIPDGGRISVRFLPDGDEVNDETGMFWIENRFVDLPFPGVLGGNESKEVKVRVPCIKTWDTQRTCPIMEAIRPWWKDNGGDEESHELARSFNPQRKVLVQGILSCPDPLLKDGEEPPENPIRKFQLNRTIFNILRAGIEEEGPEGLGDDCDPVSYGEDGLDFIIRREKTGKWADYSSSSWARKNRALTDEELEAIETHGLFKLCDWLPKMPTEEDLEVIKQMFEASVDGELYDPSLWGNYYKPFGLKFDSESSVKRKSSSKVDDEAEKGEDGENDLDKPMPIDDDDDAPKKKASKPDPEDDDDEPPKKSKKPDPEEDDEDEAPRKKSKPEPEDDDEDDAPPPKKKAKPADDDDDDEDEAPRKKAKSEDDGEKSEKGSGSALLARVQAKKRNAAKSEED